MPSRIDHLLDFEVVQALFPLSLFPFPFHDVEGAVLILKSFQECLVLLSDLFVVPRSLLVV